MVGEDVMSLYVSPKFLKSHKDTAFNYKCVKKDTFFVNFVFVTSILEFVTFDFGYRCIVFKKRTSFYVLENLSCSLFRLCLHLPAILPGRGSEAGSQDSGTKEAGLQTSGTAPENLGISAVETLPPISR
jgi:hypothetical protein